MQKFITYLQQVTANQDITLAFKSVSLEEYSNPQTLAGLTRDLCIIEHVRGLVQYTGYTPGRNFLLIHYLCCVMEYRDLAQYMYNVRNIPNSKQENSAMLEKLKRINALKQLPTFRAKTEDVKLEHGPTVVVKLEPVSKTIVKSEPVSNPTVKSEHTNLPHADTVVAGQPVKNSTSEPTLADVESTKQSTSIKQSVAPKVHRRLREQTQTCRNTSQNKFTVGQMVVVKIDITDKQFQKPETKMDCNVIGPFKIVSFFNLACVMHAKMEIPDIFEIHKNFPVDALRQFEDTEFSVEMHEDPEENTYTVHEILAIRKPNKKIRGKQKLILVKWKDFSVNEATWEPLADFPQSYVDVFRARQDDKDNP